MESSPPKKTVATRKKQPEEEEYEAFVSSSKEEEEEEEEPRTPEDDVFALPSSSSSSSSDEEEEKSDEAADGEKKKKKENKKNHPKKIHAHRWRTLGIFCTEEARDKPYLIVESKIRNGKAREVILQRVSATSELAQLIMSPLYSYAMKLSADADDNGFYHITTLEGPALMCPEIFGTRTVTTNKPEYRMDLEEMDYTEGQVPVEEQARSIMKLPLTTKHINNLVQYTCLLGPGQFTRRWRWAENTSCPPIEVRVVRSFAEDIMGFWLNAPQLWEELLDPDARTTRAATWPPHYMQLDDAQNAVRWRTFHAAHRLEKGYTSSYSAKRLLDGLPLRQTHDTGGDYTLREFMMDHKTKKNSLLAPVVFIWMFVRSLEWDDRYRNTTTILHIRPYSIHGLLRAKITMTDADKRVIPLTVAISTEDAALLNIILRENTGAKIAANRIYGLVRRAPRDRIETFGGVLNGIDIAKKERQAYALDFARCMVDEKTIHDMETSGSSIQPVSLAFHMPSIANWLYGSPCKFVDDVEKMPTEEEITNHLLKSPHRLYAKNSAGGLFRIYSTTDAIAERIVIHAIGLQLLMPMSRARERKNVSIFSLPTLLAGGSGALSALDAVLATCPLANTIIVTPYEVRRRFIALAHYMGLVDEKFTRAEEFETLKKCFCPADPAFLLNSDVQARSRVVVVDAAHLFSALDMQCIVDTFLSIKHPGITSHVFIMGSTEILSLPRVDAASGTASRPGAVFRDIVQTFKLLSHKIDVNTFPLINNMESPDPMAINDVAVLMQALHGWRTIANKPIVVLSRERPSVLHNQDPLVGLYHQIQSNKDMATLGYQKSQPTICPASLHKHFIHDEILANMQRRHHPVQQVYGIDRQAMYEISWEAVLTMPRYKLISILSHGYQIIIYDSPLPPWRKNLPAFPDPAGGIEKLCSTLQAFYKSSKQKNISRHTIWQHLGREKYIKAKIEENIED